MLSMRHHPGHGGRLGGHLRQARSTGARAVSGGRPLRCRGRGRGRCRVGTGVAVGAGSVPLGAGSAPVPGFLSARGFGRCWGWFRGQFRVDSGVGSGLGSGLVPGSVPALAPGRGLGRCRVRRGLGSRRCGQGRLLLRKDCAGHARRHTSRPKAQPTDAFFIGVFLLCTNSCAGGLSIAGIVLKYTGPPAQKASIAGTAKPYAPRLISRGAQGGGLLSASAG